MKSLCYVSASLAKNIVGGPDFDGGYLSLNVGQISVFYRKFFKHSNNARHTQENFVAVSLREILPCARFIL